MAKIRRTREFSKAKGTKGKAFFIRDIPTRFWQEAQRKAKAERRSMRAVILTLVRDWVGESNALRLADSERGREVRQVLDGDNLHAGSAEETQSRADDREPGSQVSAGVGGRVAAEVGQREDPGVEGSDATPVS